VTGGSSAAPAPSAPTASAATNTTRSGFTANWSASSGATGYRLDVSTGSGFSTYVSGYQNRDVGNVTSWTLTGLAANTTYYYRVRAYNAAGTSGNSSTINTTALTGSSFRSAVMLVHSVGTALWGEGQTASTNVQTNVAAYNSAE
jgi:phosphodiesterase/alkaline phosphatase D-like protein